MERIAAADARIVDLASVLREPPPTREVQVVEPAPDPRLLLEQERLEVLTAAREQGQAEGLARAEHEIRTRAEAAEREVVAAHAAETARLQAANARLLMLLETLPQALQQVDARVEEIAVEASYVAVLQLLGETATERDLMTRVCQRALVDYRQRPVVIRVSTEDTPALSELADGDVVKIAADPRLVPGQCQLETHKGLYDTGLEVRLEALKQAFLRALACTERAA
jgi:flagellar assembly protein FliH